MRGFAYTSLETDPQVNLAIEELLLTSCAPCLYLWQNGPSVIVGRNQNAYTECDLAYARASGIAVVRRNTGGGAVYHDLGNINYSIILPRGLHDITRSTAMVVRALQSLGVPAEASGRNDILLFGQKISGNAYYSNARTGLHHGTILLTHDAQTMGRVLAISSHKASRHGIASVRARVTDLKSHFPSLTKEAINTALEQAFCEEYGICALEEPPVSQAALAPLVEKYSSDAWNLDRINEYDVSHEASFAWGTVKVSVLFAGPTPVSCEIASDSLEPDLIDEARHVLNSQAAAPAAHGAIIDDILNVYKSIIATQGVMQGADHDL